MSNKQFFTHITGMDKHYKDIVLKHNGILKPKTAKHLASSQGIIHDLVVRVEIIKAGRRLIHLMDLESVAKKPQ